ncbi:GPW/gp25 family protein [Microbispora sp. NPDC049125]|uniref:GPW/gp25 family protein n=1 Tax=Microbispora sp. NPDC049125 TaxID=3154929 RepID=UPI00346772A6
MHIDFPFRIDAHGRTTEADDDEYARALIEQVLFTAPGERVNRPTFGSGIHQLVFEPAGSELADATRLLVHAALQQWLPGTVEVQDVEVAVRDSTLTVAVRYLTRRAARPVTSVFTRAI